MPNPDFEDLSEFFDPDEFATLVVFSRGSANLAEVLCLFNDPNQTASLGEYEMDLDQPHLICAASSVGMVKKGDTALIGTVVYDVMSEPAGDGSGIATVTLAVPNVMHNAGL